MYAEVNVCMGEGGGQPDADSSGQGGGVVENCQFLRTSFMDSP